MRDRLQEPPRLARELPDAPPEHLLEGGRPGRLEAVGELAPLGQIMRELVDEIGAAARFAGDHLDQVLGDVAVLAEEEPCQVAGLLGGQRFDHDLATLGARGLILAGLQQPGQAGVRLTVLAPVAAEEQQGRRIGGTHQVGEEVGAIEVAPVEVVDIQDQRPPVRDPGQQLPQRGEGPAPQLLLIGRLEAAQRGPGDGLDPPQDGEDPRQRRDVARQEGLGLQPGQAA